MTARALALAFSLLLLAAAAPAHASRLGGSTEVIVAVLDTGMRLSHAEFTGGQVVAWWDFTDELGPVAMPNGATWDGRWGPYDNNGHGTATAGRVGGQTTSLNPGVKLAIAKVGRAESDGGATIMNLEAGYAWAADVVKADVISISIGSIVPFPAQIDVMKDLIHDAETNGTLTVVSAGNGYGNVGVGPEFSFTTSYGHSRDVLSVGSLFDDGAESVLLTGSGWSPDVSAPGNAVRSAAIACDTCYADITGTSFAAPYVAGVAAKLISIGLANGIDAGPRYLKDLIVSCAVDMGWTYTLQGAGFVNAEALGHMTPRAAAGTLCASNPRASQPAGFASDPARAPARDFAYAGRYAFSGPGAGGQILQRVAAQTTTSAGVIGASTPAAMEVEVYELSLAAGQTGTVSVSWAQDGVIDLDVFVFDARDAGPLLVMEDAIQSSANGAGFDESATFTPAWSGTFKVVVVGWSVTASTPITVTGATYVGEGLYAGQAVA